MSWRPAASAIVFAGIAAGCAVPPVVTESMPWIPATGNSEPVIEAMPKTFKPSVVAIGTELDVGERRSREFGFLPQPQLQAYLNDILSRIKAETKLDGLPGKVYITVSEKFEAQATADGNIYVSQSTVKELKTEAEAVALLSHELAHVVFGHTDANMFSNLQKQLQTGTAVISKLERSVSSKGTVAVLTPGQEKILRRMRNAIEATDKVLVPALSREQERLADSFAIDMTRRLGYSYGSGVKKILENMMGREAKQKLEDEAEQLAQAKALAEAGFQDPKRLVGDITDFLGDSILGQLSKSHYSAEDRLKDAGEYNARFYKDMPRGSSQKENWDKLISDPMVVRTFENYEAAYAVDTLIAEGKPDDALKMARKATQRPTADHALPLYQLHKAYEAKGDRKNALATLRKATSGPEPSWEAYREIAQLEEKEGRKEDAARTMETGFAKLGQPPGRRYDLIRFYARNGNAAKVRTLELECHVKSPNMREMCTSASTNMGMGLQAVVQRGGVKK